MANAIDERCSVQVPYFYHEYEQVDGAIIRRRVRGMRLCRFAAFKDGLCKRHIRLQERDKHFQEVKRKLSSSPSPAPGE